MPQKCVIMSCFVTRCATDLQFIFTLSYHKKSLVYRFKTLDFQTKNIYFCKRSNLLSIVFSYSCFSSSARNEVCISVFHFGRALFIFAIRRNTTFSSKPIVAANFMKSTNFSFVFRPESVSANSSLSFGLTIATFKRSYAGAS